MSRIARLGLAAGLLGIGLAGAGGCVVHDSPPGYYYRTRTVYTPYGPTYVRERVYYQPAPVDPNYYPPSAAVAESPAAAQLHPLVAPIALYPDPLIAVLLPAATFPGQVRDADAWLAANPQPSQSAIDFQPWEPSVKALLHYPTVLAQLARDMQWTQSLGSAFAYQPADVMAAIQQMRAQAMAQGNLVNTPQQVVVQDGGIIAIEPANPEVIYVPQYDPVVEYVSYRPLYFGETAYATGPWFVNGIYWGGGVIFVGDWHGGYYYRDGYWRRDNAWRVDRGRYWARDGRFGPPPRIDREHYAMARGVYGHEAELHRAMVQRAPQRYGIERGSNERGGRQSYPVRSRQGNPGSREQARRGDERDGERR
ncbi:MAG TPA: DUF3300 domain-containing protein [Tepidisphaeraceae bacterium]|nr:DUF3300 domain-containing protein [Tepidisphaeraceae bacterium]